MNWKSLHCGRLTRIEIDEAVNDAEWQKVRLSMKKTSLQFKYGTLQNWLYINQNSWKARVQVTNYINALARGGLIQSIDWRKNS